MNIDNLLNQVQTDLQTKPLDDDTWTEAEKQFSQLLQHNLWQIHQMS